MLVFHIQSTGKKIDGEKVIFYFQEILIGNTSQCHIKIPSLARDQVAIKVEHFKEGALAQSIDQFPFLLGGKKIIGSKVWKLNTAIQIDSFIITLQEADFSQCHQNMKIEERYDFFQENHQEYETVLTALERELVLSDQ